jgi:hypothetical protein
MQLVYTDQHKTRKLWPTAIPRKGFEWAIPVFEVLKTVRALTEQQFITWFSILAANSGKITLKAQFNLKAQKMPVLCRKYGNTDQ